MDIKNSVIKILEGKIVAKKLDLSILMKNPTSIPEHVDFVDHLLKMTEELANLQDTLECWRETAQ